MGKFNYLKNNLIEDNGKYSIIVFQPETRFIAQHLIYNIVNDLFNVTNLRNNVYSKDIFPLFFIIDKEPRPFLLNSNFLTNFDEKLKHIYSSILCPIGFNIAHPINLKYLSIIIKDILNSSQNKRHDDIQKGIDRILKFIKFGFLQICDQKEISKHFQNILYKIRSVDESTNINLEQDFINAIRNSFQDHAETFIWCFFLANDSFQSFEAIKSFLEFVKNEKFMIEIPTNRNCRLSYFSKSKFHKKPIPLTLLRKYEASYEKYIENYIENHLNIDYGLNRKKEVGQTKYKNMYHVILSNNIKFPICNDIISHPCLIRVNEPKERDFQITFIHALNGLAGIIINYDKYGNSLYLDNFEDIKKNIVNLLAFSYPTLTELQCNLVYSQMKFIDKDASDYQYFNNVLTLENFHQQVFENNMKNKMHKIKRKSQFLFASYQFFKLNSLEMCFTEKYFDTENYKKIHLDSIITNDNIQEIKNKFRNDKIPQKNSSRYSIGIFDFYLTRSIFDVIQEKIFQKNKNFSDPFIDWFFSDQPLIVHQFQSLIYAIIDNNVNSKIISKELGLLSSLINPWIFYDYSPIREFWYAFMELLNTKDFDLSNINQISIKHVQLIFSKIQKPWIDNFELCLPYSTYVDMKLPNTKTIMNYIFYFAVFYESEKRIDLLEIFKILPFVHHTQSLIIFHKFAKFLKNVFKEQENLISILLKTFQCNSLLSIGKLMNNLLPYQQIEQYIEESNLYFDIKELIYSKDSIQNEEDQKKIEGINILNLFPQSDKSLEKSLKLAHEKWPLNDSANQIRNYLNESTKIHNKFVDCFNKISNKTVNLSDDNEIEKHVIFNASFSNLIVSLLSTEIHSIKSENNVVIDTLVSDIKSANFGEFIHTKYYLDSYDRIWNCGLDYLFDPLFSPQIANRFTERDLLQVFSKLHTLEIEEKVDVFRCLLMIFEFPGDFYPFSFESIHLKGRKLTASQLTKDICLKAQIEIGRKDKETVAFELVGKAVQILKIKNILI
ncbi:hypothetical protein TRFO_12289 [Tritrichomonas foetus]|uniref:Uncharacterized protein n=1 Tax=Tritrichomonas foetus TaxID=1144522 RepID=A0A1J4IZG3_9EUKA|nr:hypothetical protein TRFO_12289 [Tritrichomonas foetus]|eukprot:OHS92744.1 hypothetical protein TRFO_12289 [Tritrichomonas foetus]